MATRIVIFKNDSMICLLPDWIDDLNLATRIAKWMGFIDEAELAKQGHPTSECKGHFHVQYVKISTDREIGKILRDLLKD